MRGIIEKSERMMYEVRCFIMYRMQKHLSQSDGTDEEKQRIQVGLLVAVVVEPTAPCL